MGTQTPTQGTVGAKTCTQRPRKIMTRVGCHIPSAATSYPVAQIIPKPQACEVPQDGGRSVLHVGTGPPVPSAALSEQRLRHCGHSLGRGGINTDPAGAAPRLPSFPGISTSLPLSLFSASPSRSLSPSAPQICQAATAPPQLISHTDPIIQAEKFSGNKPIAQCHLGATGDYLFETFFFFFFGVCLNIATFPFFLPKNQTEREVLSFFTEPQGGD